MAINPVKKKKKSKKKSVAKKTKATKKRTVKGKYTTKKKVARKKPATTKGKKTMAKRKTRKRRKNPAARTKTITKYRYRSKPKRRRNPTSTSRATNLLGVNIQETFKTLAPMTTGALAAKFVAKRFAEGGGEMENWNWKNYLWALGGGLGASILAKQVFRASNATSQKVFNGAAFLVAYKFLTNEIAPMNSSLESWFGADEDENMMLAASDDFNPYGFVGAGEGDMYEGADNDYVVSGGEWAAADDSDRQVVPTAKLLTPNPTMGDTLVEPNPTMGDLETASPTAIAQLVARAGNRR